MKKFDIKGKRVLIMGLGLLGGGVGAARYFAGKGADVTVSDLKTKEQLIPSLVKLRSWPIRYVLGGHREKDFQEAQLIIRNPDVLPDSPYLKIARRRGIPVEMVESFFVKNCPGKIIGITGTRGKTTTSYLIARLLKEAGLPTVLAGNVAGVSTLDFLDKITAETYVVLELSSFQLHGFGESKISPHIAVVTNIFPEHLNHYQTLTEYVNDKKIIFHYQKKTDFLILNKHNLYSKKFAKEAKAKTLFFSQSDVPPSWQLKLPGEHNRENIAAAMMVGKILKINSSIMKKSVTAFKSLPYHLQVIRKVSGVTFINDGISTSPEATMAALSSVDKRVLLIAGGNDKLLDFGQLGKLVDKKAKAVFLMEGTALPKLKKSIPQNLIKGEFENLVQTVHAAYSLAKPKDIILFSPAATSFNWFNNVYQRCLEFEKIVRDLPK